MPFGSNAIRMQALKGVFGDDAVSLGAPATLYIALLRQPSGPGVTLGTEPSSTGNYARVAVSNDYDELSFTAPALTNVHEIRWPQATGLYSITDPLNQWAIYDNNSGGNLIAFGELSPTITVTGAGDEPVIPAGDFDLSMDA